MRKWALKGMVKLSAPQGSWFFTPSFSASIVLWVSVIDGAGVQEFLAPCPKWRPLHHMVIFCMFSSWAVPEIPSQVPPSWRMQPFPISCSLFPAGWKRVRKRLWSDIPNTAWHLFILLLCWFLQHSLETPSRNSVASLSKNRWLIFSLLKQSWQRAPSKGSNKQHNSWTGILQLTHCSWIQCPKGGPEKGVPLPGLFPHLPEPSSLPTEAIGSYTL